MTSQEFDLVPFGTTQTKRNTTQAAEDILYVPTPCLDKGFVRLVDYMGGDSDIVQAARVSYGRGTKSVSEDEGLIRYLMRHRHTTPFEMVELKFHAKMPIFVARQWIRHRTASVNEYSGRYSILEDDFYIPAPEDLGIQSKGNRQGREEVISPEHAGLIRRLLEEDAVNAYERYQWLLNEDSENPGKPKDEGKPMIARELARIGLSLNFYTEWYWKIDLHNLFHFLGLRMDPHAQKEIRVYANAMADMTRAVAPIAYRAFEDYRLNSVSLSGLDRIALSRVIRGEDREKVAGEIFANKRERAEFLVKLEELLR